MKWLISNLEIAGDLGISWAVVLPGQARFTANFPGDFSVEDAP